MKPRIEQLEPRHLLGEFTPSGTEQTVTFGGEANGHVIADAVWVEGLTQ